MLFLIACVLLELVAGAGKHRQAWIFLEVGVGIGKKAEIETAPVSIFDYFDMLAGLTQTNI